MPDPKRSRWLWLGDLLGAQDENRTRILSWGNGSQGARVASPEGERWLWMTFSARCSRHALGTPSRVFDCGRWNHLRLSTVSEDQDAMRRAAAVNALHRPVDVGPDVVSRPASPGTETVHIFLRHLRAKGLECVPEPLGVEGGIERLRFIPGADGGDGWFHQHTDQGLASAARLLRAIHDASADWTPPADPVWGAPQGPGKVGL